MSCIQLFLQYDSVCPQGVTQQVTHRVAPLLTGTTYGDNVRLLNSVIQVCYSKYRKLLTYKLLTSRYLEKRCKITIRIARYGKICILYLWMLVVKRKITEILLGKQLKPGAKINCVLLFFAF